MLKSIKIINYYKYYINLINRYLPISLIIITGVTILLLQNRENIGFSNNQHGNLSSHGITLSKNITYDEYPFFMFETKTYEDGEIIYRAYNRFPVFPFLLTGIIIRPFEPDLRMQIYVARQVMNIFLFIAIIMMYFTIMNIVKNKFLTISIILLSFSNYWVLFYKDMIFNDIPALCGFIYIMYGIVKSYQDKLRKREIIFLSILPVSLGWQVYSIIITWLLVEFISSVSLSKPNLIIKQLIKFLKKPVFMITIFSMIWGMIILFVQLIYEWIIVGGNFTDLSLGAMIWRLGLAPDHSYVQFSDYLSWGYFILEQLRRILISVVPFGSLIKLNIGVNSRLIIPLFITITIPIIYIARSLKHNNFQFKIPIIFALSGIAWTLPMKHFVAFHEFQSIFYIGIPISTYLLFGYYINKNKLIEKYNISAILILIMFSISLYLTNLEKQKYMRGVNKITDVTEEFQNIYDNLSSNIKVHIDGDHHDWNIAYHAVDYYLSGTYFSKLKDADYILSPNPNYNRRQITHNIKFNLFAK